MDKRIEEQTTSKDRILTLILSENQSNKYIRLAKDKGLRGGMVTIGRGTVDNTILNLLGIKNQKKEIVRFLLGKEKAKSMLDYFNEELQLETPDKGIAYTTSVMNVAGFPNLETDQEQLNTNTVKATEGKSMFKKLTVVVDFGMAEDVMDIARKAGVRGGTIMHGRGAGAEIATKLFGMEIEPEKELVIILIPNDLVDKVMQELTHGLNLDEPGKGVLYVEPILETRGLFEMNDKNQRRT